MTQEEKQTIADIYNRLSTINVTGENASLAMGISLKELRELLNSTENLENKNE